jgi:hypothetical protein
MNKNITYAGIIVALAAATFAFFGILGSGTLSQPMPSVPAHVASTTVPATTPANKTRVAPAQKDGESERAPQAATTTTAIAPITAATLIVDGVSYGVIADTSVYEAMREVATRSSFTFTGENYPSLGYFVESIGGKKGGNGYYWILYVNGKSSDAGASQTTLKPGDSVEWKYEKSY